MNKNEAAFTVKYPELVTILESEIHLQSDINNTITKQKYMAVWDTGATSSVISPKAVKELNLKPVSYTRIVTAGDKKQCAQYLVDIILPHDIVAKDFLVIEAELGDYDALIGMDVIGGGDFAVTNFNSKTTLSFRVPSVQEIDFER